jgi:hypothetical protein
MPFVAQRETKDVLGPVLPELQQYAITLPLSNFQQAALRKCVNSKSTLPIKCRNTECQ